MRPAAGEVEGLAKGENIGRTKQARRLVARLGVLRFGEPSPTARKALDGIDSVERLEGLLERAILVESWDELLR